MVVRTFKMSLWVAVAFAATVGAQSQTLPEHQDHMRHRFDPARDAKRFDDPAREQLADARSSDSGP
jgi:DnaJ-domain-containing protein 1